MLSSYNLIVQRHNGAFKVLRFIAVFLNLGGREPLDKGPQWSEIVER